MYPFVSFQTIACKQLMQFMTHIKIKKVLTIIRRVWNAKEVTRKLFTYSFRSCRGTSVEITQKNLTDFGPGMAILERLAI